MSHINRFNQLTGTGGTNLITNKQTKPKPEQKQDEKEPKKYNTKEPKTNATRKLSTQVKTKLSPMREPKENKTNEQEQTKVEPNPNKTNMKQNHIDSYFKTNNKPEKDDMMREPAVDGPECKNKNKEPIGTNKHLKSTSMPGTRTKPRIGTKVKTLQLTDGLSTLRNFLESKAKARLERNQNCTQPTTSKDAADFKDFKENFQREDYRGTKIDEGNRAPSRQGTE